MMVKRIHPAFKRFIITDATKRWDDILKQSRGVGIDAGVCFTTANAFCQIFDRNLGIPCKLEAVETLMGNAKAKELYDFYIRDSRDFQAFLNHIGGVLNEKGKDNLTLNDPVTTGIGFSPETKDHEWYHFVMNLPQQTEVIDLTIGHLKRPQWGINCNNYWAKYDNKDYKNGNISGEDVWVKSGCVLDTVKKEVPVTVGVNPEQYKKELSSLREWMYHQLKTRNIPVFMER
jgi:hypothetical protein